MVTALSELILIKKASMVMKNLEECKSTLMNQLKNKLKNQLKSHWLMILCLKCIVQKILPEYLERTYCASCKKYTGNSHIISKIIDNKVKSLKTKCVKCKHDESMLLKQIK